MDATDNREEARAERPCQGVVAFLNELQPLNSCLLELAILTAATTNACSADNSHHLYEKVIGRFLEEARRAKLPLVEVGGSA